MKEKLLTFTVLALVSTLFLSVLFWFNFSIIPNLSSDESFLVPWMGARSFLFEQANPYSLDVTQETQIKIYGETAQEGEYPYRLDIPFYILFFYFPFALIEDFALARALWMSFAEIALFGVGFLSIYLTEWKLSRVNKALFFAALFLSFYGLYPLLEGSAAILTALILLASLVAIREKRDEALGILLLFGTLYLQSGGVLLFFILFMLITSKHWKVFSVSIMTLVALLGITLMILPNWIVPFASSLLSNARVGQGFLLSETLQIWRPDDGVIIADSIKWVSLLILIFEWFTMRGRNFQHILWVASLSLAITPFLGIRTTSAIYPILFFPLALVFKAAQDRWYRADWGISLTLLLLLASWIIFFRVPHALEVFAYLLPFLLVFALYWMRWWLLRSPRTWADQL